MTPPLIIDSQEPNAATWSRGGAEARIRYAHCRRYSARGPRRMDGPEHLRIKRRGRGDEAVIGAVVHRRGKVIP
jgi:hypothetical protein